jgi:hypothetical protein
MYVRAHDIRVCCLISSKLYSYLLLSTLIYSTENLIISNNNSYHLHLYVSEPNSMIYVKLTNTRAMASPDSKLLGIVRVREMKMWFM